MITGNINIVVTFVDQDEPAEDPGGVTILQLLILKQHRGTVSSDLAVESAPSSPLLCATYIHKPLYNYS